MPNWWWTILWWVAIWSAALLVLGILIGKWIKWRTKGDGGTSDGGAKGTLPDREPD